LKQSRLLLHQSWRLLLWLRAALEAVACYLHQSWRVPLWFCAASQQSPLLGTRAGASHSDCALLSKQSPWFCTRTGLLSQTVLPPAYTVPLFYQFMTCHDLYPSIKVTIPASVPQTANLTPTEHLQFQNAPDIPTTETVNPPTLQITNSTDMSL